MYRETESVELKRKFNDTIEKEIVAFLNTHDGIIYIGVEDDGTVVGVEKTDETLKQIADIITNGILPNSQEFIKLGTEFVDGKYLIYIKVEKGSSLYYIKRYGRSSNGCYVRMGTTCRSMTEEQIENYHNKLLNANTKITDIAINKNSLKFGYLQMLYKDKGLTLNDETFEENLELKIDGKYNIQAELLSDENRYSIKVVKFAGQDKASEIVVRNEYGYKCLIVAMKQAYEYLVDVINQTKTIFIDGIREDKKLFDTNAFREVWFNACLHNDWVDGTPPAIYIYNDRLEIISTGGLPHNLSRNDFFSGISKPVNTSLTKIFIQLGLIEQTGHGVPLVVKKYGTNVFEFLDNFLRVTIPFEYKIDNKNSIGNDIINDIINDTLNDSEKLILNKVKLNPNITISELEKSLKKSNRTITRNLKNLQDKNYIKRIGSRKTGYWKIMK